MKKRNTKILFMILVAMLAVVFMPNESLAKTTLKAPQSFTVKATGYNTVKLSWKKVTGSDGYRVYRKKSGETKYKTLATLKNVSSYTDKKAMGGITYVYAVRAYKKSGSTYTWGSYNTAGKKVTSEMQPRKISLKVNKTYTQYDATGDGQNDTVTIKTKKSSSSHQIKIYINNKLAYTYTVGDLFEPKSYYVHLCTPKSNAVLFSVRYESGENDCQEMHQILRYTGGKLKLTYDVQKKLVSWGIGGSNISSVGNGYISIRYWKMSSYGSTSKYYRLTVK